MQPTVFLGSAASIVAVVLFGVFFTETAAATFSAVQAFIAKNFGWVYVLGVSFLVAFVVWLFFSPFGKIRLGGDDVRPEFSYFAWFTMLFSAGMGIGLVFWSIGEPMMHYLSPPLAEGQTPEAMAEAMRMTFFHWGFHPWAIYIVFGLSIAYFHFRHGLPLAPRSMLYPIIGNRFRGMPGHLLDMMCVVGTLFGVATSLGFGAMQINSGLSEYIDVPQSTQVQILIIAGITLIATISVVSGIEKGIRLLSEFNMILAGLMLLFIFAVGPTLFQIKLFATSLGGYLQHFVETSLWMDLRPDNTWQTGWTIFYWGWWVSWSPFVGIFSARMSKGRTLREFVVSVLMVPTLLTFVWMSIFGGTGLHIEIHGAGGIADVVNEDVALALHAVLNQLPWAAVTSGVGTLLVIVFFITSSDSGSLVIDMVTSGGHPDPPTAQRVFWAVSEGAVASVLLYAGGLAALQTASIAVGLPLMFFLIFVCYGLYKALKVDVATEGVPERQALVDGAKAQESDDEAIA